MSLESQVVAFTAATEELLQAVNTRKVDLDTASTTAVTKAAEAGASAVAAAADAAASAGSAVSAGSSATSATNSMNAAAGFATTASGHATAAQGSASSATAQALAAAGYATTAEIESGVATAKAAEVAAAVAVAEAARDAATVNADVYATTAAAFDKGVSGATITAAGTGGTNGTFALAFSGGAGTGAAGTFTVAGGAVTAVAITARGTGYTSAPTVSLAASAGLTGATVTAAISTAVPLGAQFQVAAVDGLSVQRYRHDAGPVATAVGPGYPSKLGVTPVPSSALRAKLLADGATESMVSVGSRPNVSGIWTSALGYGAFSSAQDVGVDVPVDSLLQLLRLSLQVAAGCTNVKLTLWTRSLASASLNAAPGAVDDELLAVKLFTVGSISITPGAGSFAIIDFELDTPIAAKAGTCVMFEVEALDASAGRVGVGVMRDSVIDPEQRNRGFLRANTTGGTGWTAITSSSVAWNWMSPVFTSLTQLKTDVDAFAVKSELVASKLISDDLLTIASRAYNSAWSYSSSTFKRWAFGISSTHEHLDRLVLSIDGVSAMDSIKLTIYERPTPGAGVPGIAGDVLKLEQTFLTSEFEATLALQDAVFDFPLQRKASASMWMVLVEPIKEGSTPSIGFGRLSGVTGINQAERGYFTTVTAWDNVPDTGSQYALAYQAFASGQVLKNVQAAELLNSIFPSISQSGLVSTVNMEVVKNGAHALIGGSVTFPAAASGSERFDLIVADRLTGVISRVAGTERAGNDAIEYIVATPANKDLLYTAKVSETDVQTVQSAGFRGLIKRGTEAELHRLQIWNRSKLRKTIGKSARGSAIKFGGYGDSITALQNTGLLPAIPDRYAANGAWRDRMDYYFTSYAADTKALIPLFDFSDGAGAVHCKLGWNWAIKAAMDELAGSDVVQYLNYGLGSTTSAATTGNGLDATRIAVPIAAGLDTVTVAFGMNELGATTTYANLVNIAAQFASVGTEVVLVGVPRPNALHASNGVAWQYTNDAIEAAAFDSGAAYVSTKAIADDRNLGGIGAPVSALCATNRGSGNNHPGIRELLAYGSAAVLHLGI